MAGHPAGERGLRGTATVAILFGLVTILSSGRALFGQPPAGAGAVVPIVPWFNIAAGLASVLAGAGLLAREPWAVWLASLMALATTAVFGTLGVHIAQGGACDVRSIGAMMLWTVAWQTVTVVAWRSALTDRPEFPSGHRGVRRQP
ncbi:hypothetical protein [Microvirga sp. Mcv34]|uniref:hypothetical protein n=1 Tax=Microvirga sp. Mcv34 TaxID=2926016 RepID=UPI0021CA87C8|nr:hypothetical protein [Microvirga sp. Mcv34]